MVKSFYFWIIPQKFGENNLLWGKEGHLWEIFFHLPLYKAGKACYNI